MEPQGLKNGCTQQIIFFDDLSFLDDKTNKDFNEIMYAYLNDKMAKYPIIFMITDVNDANNDYARKDEINNKNIFTSNVVNSERCKHIKFLAIATYLMINALQKYINKKYGNDKQKRSKLIPSIEKRTNGDLRQAIKLLRSFLTHVPGEVMEEINSSIINYDTTLNVLSHDYLTDKYTVVKNVLYNFRTEPNVFNETSIKLKELIGKEVVPDEMPDRHPIKIMPEDSLDNLDHDFYLDLLQNNYINHYSNISEIAFVAERLSRSDCLIGCGDITVSNGLYML
ncbi:9353_t:CDS:2 [Entrophospora sp. SA101]|nr:9353_t:CDS:2 [Entrophospora sp. SA101]